MLLNRRDMLSTSALLAAGLFAGCGRDSNPILRVGTSIWPGYEPLFMAHESGYFDETIQIVEYPGTPEIHRSFQNHAIEAATVTLDEALMLAQMQPDIRVVMAIDFSNGADALLAKPEITSLVELRGKRVGAEPNAVGAFILSRVLERAELTANDVTIVPLSTTRIEAAFLADTVDAIVTYEPASSRLRAAGATVLFDSAQMPGEIADVLIVRQDNLKAQQQALVRLLTEWLRAVNAFNSRDEGATEFAADHEGLTTEEFSQIQRRIELLDLPRNLALFESPGGALFDTVRKLSASLKKYGLISEMVDPNRLLDATILKQVQI